MDIFVDSTPPGVSPPTNSWHQRGASEAAGHGSEITSFWCHGGGGRFGMFLGSVGCGFDVYSSDSNIVHSPKTNGWRAPKGWFGKGNGTL